MKATIEAAKRFVESLPDSSSVWIVDFNTQVNTLSGSTKADALKNLETIKAGGGTKLYDATAKGVELVKGKSRPAAVVFTDGVDSRDDIPAYHSYGSLITKDEAVDLIRESNVPVYTIRFSEKNFGRSDNIHAVPHYAAFCV